MKTMAKMTGLQRAAIRAALINLGNVVAHERMSDTEDRMFVLYVDMLDMLIFDEGERILYVAPDSSLIPATIIFQHDDHSGLYNIRLDSGLEIEDVKESDLIPVEEA
jgi:hypothetical protein